MSELIGQTILALVCADFLAGFGHWLEDTYCWEDFPIPFIRNFICEPNIEHHHNPQSLDGSDFWSRNHFQLLLGCVGYMAVAFVIGGSYFWFMTMFFMSFANEVHFWNHQGRLTGWRKFLRDTTLIQTMKMHSLHHKHVIDNYCVITNWVNPILDGIRFWRGLEIIIGCCTLRKVLPKRYYAR